MRREVGSIQASHGADHLLRRKAFVTYNHEVAGDGFWVHLPKGADYVATAKKERLACNPDLCSCGFLCHGFSVVFSLVRL
jgi:hypothetical protein